jgi:hypothetical protein
MAALGVVQAMVGEAISPELIKRRMWLEYQYASNNPSNAVDCIHDLITNLTDPNLKMHQFLQDAAETIHNRLCIKQVTIGLKNPKDGVFRYEVMSGLSDSEWDAHLRLFYTLDQFDNPNVYKYFRVSKYTRLYLVEDNPYRNGEENTYSRSEMLQSTRRTLDDTIEGDYLDIYILGKNDELEGWLEISGLNNGKFPDVQTLKVVELLASVIAIALTETNSRAG